MFFMHENNHARVRVHLLWKRLFYCFLGIYIIHKTCGDNDMMSSNFSDTVGTWGQLVSQMSGKMEMWMDMSLIYVPMIQIFRKEFSRMYLIQRGWINYSWCRGSRVTICCNPSYLVFLYLLAGDGDQSVFVRSIHKSTLI